MTESEHPLKVLIAGGGTAALEAALALRDLAGDRVATTLLSPEADFVYRPLRVREPFAGPTAHHYPLADFARDVGVEFQRDAFKWLDFANRTVHTVDGQQLRYDALLLAMGARMRQRFKHAITLDDRKLDEQLHGVIQDIEAGYVHKLAFIAPNAMAWPMPLYELALLTAHRAYDMNELTSVTIVTSEDAPLAMFGREASLAVRRLLEEARINLITSTTVETPEAGHVALHPGTAPLVVDRIIALPELFGPSTPGVPKEDAHGFIPVTPLCAVKSLDRVFAAGDATDFPIKHGGLATLQADTAAVEIARLAGVPLESQPFTPWINAILLGGSTPLHLVARFTGEHGLSTSVSDQPSGTPTAKITARYLTPYLESFDHPPAASQMPLNAGG